MPRMVALADRPDGVALLDLNDADVTWDMTLAWRRDGYLSQAARAFIDLVQEMVAEE
jgi:DNA-binding transcriptional LysR family regulator